MIQTSTKYVHDILLYRQGSPVHVYEILDYITLPYASKINTGLIVDSSTIAEITCQLNSSPDSSRRFFSSMDPENDGWNAPGTWALDFESYTQLSIFPLGYAGYQPTTYSYSNLAGLKLRYNLTAAGVLTIYNPDGTVFYTYDVTQYTDPTYISSSFLKLFTISENPNDESLTPGTYVYECKIWKNGSLVQHYVPVKRLSDNAIGFYDIVNETFHTNEFTDYAFTGTSKSTPEYIDESSSAVHINRIYNRGKIYWGGDVAPTPPPQPTGRYIPALYCMNNNSSSSNQADHATFTISWTPDPSIAHSIDVELEPITRTSSFYNWSLFFGGNTSTMQHMGNIYGFYTFGTTRILVDAFNSSMDTNAYNINNYLNVLWRIQISNAAEAGGQRNCGAIVKAGNNILINATSVSTRSNWGTFDPYFIFGSQIQHSTSSFGAWQFKLYKFDIYDDNVLMYQLRPYYDTVNQEYGMYDLVNNIFYPSMNETHPFTGELPQS